MSAFYVAVFIEILMMKISKELRLVCSNIIAVMINRILFFI